MSRIFLDMDGVVVDKRGRLGFDTFPWLPGGKEIVAAAGDFTFLTRVADKRLDQITLEKRAWIDREIGLGQPMIVVPESSGSKSNYCKPGDLLVDDSDTHYTAWRNAGGEFILHRQSDRTVEGILEYKRRYGLIRTPIAADYHVVTSFSQSGYELYGRAFVDSFRRFWPKEVTLHIWTEHFGRFAIPECPGRDVRMRNLMDVEACRDFLQRHADNLVVQGRERHPDHHWRPKTIQEGYSFRYDAYRFCRKIFAIAATAQEIQSGYLFWIDGDAETKTYVPLSFLRDLLGQAEPLCYLGRRGYHSECGFVGYNLDHPEIRPFIQAFAALYASDEFMRHREWHDSWIFDRLREERKIGGRDLLARQMLQMDPFPSSVLGQYMIHKKGAKKGIGR